MRPTLGGWLTLRLSLRRPLLPLALFFGLAGAGYAADDRDTCFAVSGDRDAMLAACARYIESGQARGMDLSDAYFFRGLYLNAGGERDRALEEISEAIRLDGSEGPITVQKLAARAELYWAKGEYDRALADLDQSLKLDPKRASTFHWRGLTYARMGDHSRAAAEFQEASRLDPDDQNLKAYPPTEQELLYYLRGLAYESVGERDKALADYNYVLSLNEAREEVRQRISALTPQPSAPPEAASTTAQPSTTGTGVAAASTTSGPHPARPIFEKYGLLGIWSADCNKPASPQNEYLVFRALDGQRIQNDGMIGPTERRYAVVIKSAAGAGANEIILTLQDVDVRWRVEGKRMRPLERARDGGKAAVEEELWIEKCN